MRSPRFLLLLLALAIGLALALLRPLPSRAAEPPAPGPMPTSVEDPPAPAPLPGVAAPRALSGTRHARKAAALGVRVVKYAERLLGVPYRYGGSSPRSGFDCSGLVRYVYGHFGISLPHSSFADYVRGRSVSRWALEPGDLVFFHDAGHVGIYIGHRRFIHAPHSGAVVRIETLRGWYGTRLDGARRVF